MNFKLWLESHHEIDEDTKRAIYEKATTVGIPARRGTEGYAARGKPFKSDPGDFGRGVYYTTDYKQALYGYGGGDPEKVVKTLIKFKNPLVLTVDEAYELSDEYETVNQQTPKELLNWFKDDKEKWERWHADNPYDIDVRLKNAERLTMDMLKKGHDGLIVIHARQRRTPKEDPFTRFEIVDYRPYA